MAISVSFPMHWPPIFFFFACPCAAAAAGGGGGEPGYLPRHLHNPNILVMATLLGRGFNSRDESVSFLSVHLDGRGGSTMAKKDAWTIPGKFPILVQHDL